MNLNNCFFASVLLSLCLLTACGDSGTSVSADGTPIASFGSTPWSELSEVQQGVMSVLESVWPDIPADDQKELMEDAERWTRMQPREQAEFRESWNQYLNPVN